MVIRHIHEWSRAATDQTILEQHSVLQQQITRNRALALVSNLTGVEVKSPAEVVEHIRDLTPAVRKSSSN